MPALTTPKKCPACGKMHAFFIQDRDLLEQSARIEFTCPDKAVRSSVEVTDWGQVVAVRPPGSVRAKVVE